MNKTANAVPGTIVYFQSVQDVQIATRTSRAQYQYTLASTDVGRSRPSGRRSSLAELKAFAVLREVALETKSTAACSPDIEVDRVTAGRLGVTMQAVNDALNNAFGQRQVSTIYAQANQYRVVLEAHAAISQRPFAARAASTSLQATGAQVPLTSLAKMEYTTAPLAISHQDQFPSHDHQLQPARKALALSDAFASDLDTREATIGMPASVTGSFYGDASEFSKSLASQPWLILAAIVTIYIVLGVLYESFVHPFTILTTLPSAGIGALLALDVHGHRSRRSSR